MQHAALVVSHTHWDREWYLPFQEFRMRLIDTIDDRKECELSYPRSKVLFGSSI